MIATFDYVRCNATCVDAPEMIAYLRHVGDIRLPVVDSDFLPAETSLLITVGRFERTTLCQAMRRMIPTTNGPHVGTGALGRADVTHVIQE